MEIAASLGADVPFFLLAAALWPSIAATKSIRSPNAAKQTILVVSPRDIGVSTKDAYEWISAELTKTAKPPKIWGFCALCWSKRGAGLSNDFEDPVFRRHPRLGEIRDALLKRGAMQMPRWRVAGRRCSESSETQRRRAEPLVHSRKIRFSSSKLYPGKTTAVRLVGVRTV